MEIHIAITTQPIDLRKKISASATDLGAAVEFSGIVRGEENGQPIRALEYEAYQPMAESAMRGILRELGQRHACRSVHVTHRIGVVPVGEAAIQVAIFSKHRAEAFALLAGFMDRLKQDVPIWKRRALSDSPAATTEKPRDGAKSFGEILAEIHCEPLPVVRANLDAAAGCVLRETIVAPEDQPAFDRSAVDGFAVRCDDSSPRFTIVDEIRAGDWKPRELKTGETVRIATGGALPGDGLQVVMKEDAQADGQSIRLTRRSEARFIRFRGEDARAGQILLESGARLTPGALALLASLGIAQPLVTRPAKVRHLATGNEIIAPEQTPQRGQIRDSNSVLVRSFLAHWHCEITQRRLPEDEAILKTALAGGEDDFDLLLISGGASVGEHDFTRRILEQSGFLVLVAKTNLRPGKPLIVARRGRQFAFGLPGNPVAHFVCLNLFVRAALEQFSGSPAASQFQNGTLAGKLSAGNNPRETFWPARLQSGGDTVSLTPLDWSSSGDVTALAAANALIRVPAHSADLPPGANVEFVPTIG